jgi:dTDP-4-dehydrorhamnose 3,5-epimerase
MIFTRTAIAGVCIIDPERLEDDRGFFARVWCRREFEAQGLNPGCVRPELI